ncbi:tyrosine-protein phosphatase [Nocardia sp. NPDC056000]|uniref:tyrosine-protein phosphatase n=1 Tax=Nocardia sp. NPDC056000 TaxID=3345674 RepID=UPI0035DCBCA0
MVLDVDRCELDSAVRLGNQRVDALADMRRRAEAEQRRADDDNPRWRDMFAKIPNVRDLGGIPTKSGGEVRSGIIIRSGTPEHATPEDVTALVDSLGVGSVVDVRAPKEAAAGRGLLNNRNDVVALNMPIGSPVPQVPGKTDFVKVYRESLEASPESIVALARHVLDADGAVLIHCLHGKDRTAVAVAALLDGLGVSSKEILADFMLTNRRLEQIRSVEGIRPPRPAQARAMTGALDILESYSTRLGLSDGGGYLIAHGFTTDELVRLRAKATTGQIERSG